MNIHEAIKLLKAGMPVYRRSVFNIVYAQVVNEELSLKLYGSKNLSYREPWNGHYLETASFTTEDIQANDWEVYRPEKENHEL